MNDKMSVNKISFFFRRQNIVSRPTPKYGIKPNELLSDKQKTQAVDLLTVSDEYQQIIYICSYK